MSRTDEKGELIEYLRDTPLVNMACKRFGISRATFYRWCKEDKHFNEAVGVVLKQGRENINELAKATIIKMIKKENFNATRFWLQNNDEVFRPKYFRHNDPNSDLYKPIAHKPLSDEELVEADEMYPATFWISDKDRERIEEVEPVKLIMPTDPEVANKYLNPEFEAEWDELNNKELTDDELRELLKKYPEIVNWKHRRRLKGKSTSLTPKEQGPQLG